MTHEQRIETRTCTREFYYQSIRPVLRTLGLLPREDESYIAERAYIKTVLDEHTDEHGYVGIVDSGMDCDCVRYCYGSVYHRMTVMRFVKLRDDTYNWADGPCNVSICPVDDLPDNYSRDLALEAYEDGHAHVVSTARFDEDGAY